MLAPSLRKIVENKTPKMNPIIAGGLASTEMKYVMPHLDACLRDTMQLLSIYGLTYNGYRYLTAGEEFTQVANPNVNRSPGIKQVKSEPRTVDLRRNDMRMVAFDFSYQGKPLSPKYMQIPYVEKYGMAVISGSRYSINPVLKDTFPSVSKNTIFASFMKAKIIFRRLHVMMHLNGQQKLAPVVWAPVFNDQSAQKNIKRGQDMGLKSTMVHYLMIRYGFSGTMERYCGLKVGSDIHITNVAEMHKFNHDEWNVYSCSDKRVSSVYKNWDKPTIAIAVAKSKDNDNVLNIIAGIIYIAMHFPGRIVKEYMDEPLVWKQTFGQTLFGSDEALGIASTKVQAHIESLDSYIETQFIEELKILGFHIENIYDLFILVIFNFDAWLNKAALTSSSTYGKRIVVKYYGLYDITYVFNRAYFTFMSLFKRAGNKPITEDDINKIFTKHFKPGRAFKLISSEHGNEVAAADAVGDNYHFGITSTLVRQTLTASTKARREDISSPDMQLDSSVAEICGYANIPKNDLSARGRINADMILSDDRFTRQRPEFKDVLDRANKYIRMNRS